MKYHLVLLFILSLAQSCWGQTAFISGKVVEQYTNLPVAFASATLFGETENGWVVIDTFETDTSAMYYFDLDTVFFGYRILGNAFGFIDNEILINGVNAGDSLVLDLKIPVEPIILINGYVSWQERYMEICFKRMKEFPLYFLLMPFYQPIRLQKIIERF